MSVRFYAVILLDWGMSSLLWRLLFGCAVVLSCSLSMPKPLIESINLIHQAVQYLLIFPYRWFRAGDLLWHSDMTCQCAASEGPTTSWIMWSFIVSLLQRMLSTRASFSVFRCLLACHSFHLGPTFCLFVLGCCLCLLRAMSFIWVPPLSFAR